VSTPLEPPSAAPEDLVARAPLVGPLGELALAVDPTLVMRRAGLRPDPWQRDLLFDEAGWYLLLCCRQSGKTTALGAMALHAAVTRPRSLCLVLTPSLRQSQEALRRVAEFYHAVHGAPVREDNVTALKVELANGSRVIALPGSDDKTVRVYSAVDLLLCDEAARIPDDLFHATTPMLATSGGRAVLASTPWFRRGYMYQQWRDGGDAWRRVRITADECPRIDRGFLERERRSKPAAWFRQEYHAEWGSTAAALFPRELVDAAVSPEVEAYRPDRLRFA
jgi:hypothetical protein